MVNKIRISVFIKPLLLLLAAAAGVLIWHVYFNKSDKELIKEQLYQFRSNASKYAGEGMAQGVLKCKALEKLFDKTCHVNINVDMFAGSFSPEEVSSKAIFCRNHCASAVINFYNIKVTVDGDAADAALTASLDGSSRDGKRFNEYRELLFSLKKIEGKWLIYKIDIHQIIEK
ncbi:MAG: hypothetical protein WCV67_04430 [Victivallaceae bacterium]|jgi:hypothetical protein